MPSSFTSPVVDLFAQSSSTLVFSGSECSAEQIADHGRQLGVGLETQGLAHGDRVALWMQNGEAYLESFVACAAAGFVAISINTRYSVVEVESLLQRAGVRLVITDQDWTPPDGVGVVDADTLASLRQEPVEDQGRAGDRCVMFTTSGTTSKPKMVIHQQASIATHAHEVAASSGYRVDDVALVVMPLCGTFGLASLTAVLAANCHRVHVPDGFEVSHTAALIEHERVTVVNGSDDLFHRVLGTDADLSSVRIGGYGRFNTSLDGIVERAEARGMCLVGLYGMSEVQALFSIRGIENDAATRGRAGGTLMSGSAQARVIDGELQLQGPSLFEGYLAEGGETIDEALTTGAMDGDWFCTGDSALMDDVEETDGQNDGDFTFITRLGDVLRIGGFLVAPAEIEKVLMEVEGIEAAQVVAIDRPSGSRPVAFVVLADGASEIDEDAVKSHCANDLAKFKIPIRVLTVGNFPTGDGANGAKILSNELRAMALEAVS